MKLIGVRSELFIEHSRYTSKLVHYDLGEFEGSLKLNTDLEVYNIDSQGNEVVILQPYYTPESGHVGWHKAPVTDNDGLETCYTEIYFS